MNNTKNGFRSKAAAAVKFFFTGNEEVFHTTSSSARELCKKYGVKNGLDALERATMEELLHHLSLFKR